MIKPGITDRIAMAAAEGGLCRSSHYRGGAVVRPWVLVLAFALLIIPSEFLVAGLNTGAAFLKIDTGARPTAMGGPYTALSFVCRILRIRCHGFDKVACSILIEALQSRFEGFELSEPVLHRGAVHVGW